MRLPPVLIRARLGTPLRAALLTLVLACPVHLTGCAGGTDAPVEDGGTDAPLPPLDSDGNGILDADEGDLDTDNDGTLDLADPDDDGDGLSDVVELAGSPSAPPDTDSDGIPDFRDADSDDDHIGDREEVALGTDPLDADSDDDGAEDLVEVTLETDPLDGASNPAALGISVIVVEQTEAPQLIDVATRVQHVDLYLLMDETGSMGSSVTAARSAFAGSLAADIRAIVPDTRFGVGGFQDYGVDPYGSVGSNEPYLHHQDLTDDLAALNTGLGQYDVSGGGDGPEGNSQGLWAAITGGALPFPGSSVEARSGCPQGTFGWPCFREDAMPIVVMVSDAPWHNGSGDANPYDDFEGEPQYADVVAAAVSRHVRLVGIGQGTGSVADMQAFGVATGATDSDGDPYVQEYDLTASGFASAVLAQIDAVVNRSTMEITLTLEDDPLDAVDTTLAFLERVVAYAAGDVDLDCAAQLAEDRDNDTFAELFPAVLPSERVCFEVQVKNQTAVTLGAEAQIFRATAHASGDGFTPLDSRDVVFLVPPAPIEPGAQR